MSVYRRILYYVRPYWKWLALSMGCSLVFSVFSGVSIYLTLPLLETLFHGAAAAESASAGT